MATDKPPTSYRLSHAARELIDRLAEHMGVSRTDVLEMAVRQLARRELENTTAAKQTRRKRHR